MNTMKWYNLMNKAGVKSMSMFCDEESVRTRLASNLYDFAWDMWNASAKIDRAMKARDVVQIPLCFLAKSLENMSLCHAVYFCKGWENARGCWIEHDAAKAYGLKIIYED